MTLLEFVNKYYGEIEAKYKKACFDNKHFNRFIVDDHIYGSIEDSISIEMCDTHIQNHTGSGKRSNTEEIFQGIFAYTKCNKNIGTYIKVAKNKVKILEQKNLYPYLNLAILLMTFQCSWKDATLWICETRQSITKR